MGRTGPLCEQVAGLREAEPAMEAQSTACSHFSSCHSWTDCSRQQPWLPQARRTAGRSAGSVSQGIRVPIARSSDTGLREAPRPLKYNKVLTPRVIPGRLHCPFEKRCPTNWQGKNQWALKLYLKTTVGIRWPRTGAEGGLGQSLLRRSPSGVGARGPFLPCRRG